MAHIPADRRVREAMGVRGAASSSRRPREANHILQDGSPSSAASTSSSSSWSWSPSFGLAFRLLVIARLTLGRSSIIADCDETFNYWEPLHLLVYPPSRAAGAASSLLPFQTWEYAPQFAIRSYAYLLPYWAFARTAATAVVGLDKINTFYLIRNVLAIIASLAEAKLVTAIGEAIHPRVATYTLLFLATSAGTSAAATALLPSSFAMYTTTLAMAYALYPARLPSPNSAAAPSNLSLVQTPFSRTFIATSVFALGALLGWPFAIVLAVPFVLEEVFLPSGNQVSASAQRYLVFLAARLGRFVRGALAAGLLIGAVTTIIDTLAYGRVTIVPLGIIIYNVLSAKRGAGPELYGTEPASYYLANLGLAFNLVLPLALLAAPLAILTVLVAPEHFAAPAHQFPLTSSSRNGSTKGDKKDALISTSRLTLLLVRLAPFYLWLGLLTSQPHKEERFMFPAYGLLCFNGAVALFLVKALLDKALGSVMPSQSASSSKLKRLSTIITISLLILTSLISMLRTTHLQTSYGAPISVLEHFSKREVPQLLGRAFPASLKGAKQRARLRAGLEPFDSDEEERRANAASASKLAKVRHQLGLARDGQERLPSLARLVNMTLLTTEFSATPGSGKPAPIRLCYGKEWHRFPGHFFVPHGVVVDFVKSEFGGILPKHFAIGPGARQSELKGIERRVVRAVDRLFGRMWTLKDVTRNVQDGFNDMNREEPDRYVSIDACDYLVDLDHRHRYAAKQASDPRRSSLEPRHAIDSERWTRVHCEPFLDSAYAGSASSSASASGGLVGRALHKLLAVLDRTLFIPTPVRGIVSATLQRLGLGRWESARAYGDYCLLRTTRKESWANRRGHVQLD